MEYLIINGIFTQVNPSVLSTVINRVLLTNKSEIIKIYKLKTIKNTIEITNNDRLKLS